MRGWQMIRMGKASGLPARCPKAIWAMLLLDMLLRAVRIRRSHGNTEGATFFRGALLFRKTSADECEITC